MSLFPTRKQVTIEVTVFNKDQKDAFFDLMSEFREKAERISHGKNYIKYRVVFEYTIHYNWFAKSYQSMIPKYKFKFQKK